MNNTEPDVVRLSVIIKTLNEEKSIARCVDAVLSELQGMSIEVIVADSGSSDRTVEIASMYPITVVQLRNVNERSCGIGAQLGFQHSQGEFVLILDADMVLHGEFIRAALARMEREPRCGAIGGLLVERSGVGYEYRSNEALEGASEERVSWLNGCALYRRAAILSVGYLTNRNLHAYEEKELGLRLKYADWLLLRLPVVAVDHFGHTVGTAKLLWRRWKSGYAAACGESIRACLGKPYLREMLLVHKAHVACLVFQVCFVISLIALPWLSAPFVLALVAVAMVFVVQTLRKKSLSGAAYSLLYTNVFGLGVAKGLMQNQLSPSRRIESLILASPRAPAI